MVIGSKKKTLANMDSKKSITIVTVNNKWSLFFKGYSKLFGWGFRNLKNIHKIHQYILYNIAPPVSSIFNSCFIKHYIKIFFN